MIINLKEIEEQIVTNMRGGEGEVLVKRIDSLPNNVTMCGQITLKKNDSIGVHVHIDSFEVLYVISGSATIIDDGQIRELHQGDVNICLCNHTHSIINNLSDEFVAFATVIKTK